MKKFSLICLIVAMSVMLSSIAMAKPKQNPSGPPALVVNGTVIPACYQKINGQLRVVSDPGQCRPSEVPISLSSPPQPKTVFITSLTYVGAAIGGIAGADALCNTLAATVVPGLAGTYKAWISDDSMGPATTFTHNMGPYVNTHGDIIANDWIGLTSGVILKPILYDESGANLTPPTGGPIDVWTGTDPFGHPVVGQTCFSWTAVGVDGIQGLGMVTTPLWTMAPPPANCTGMAHLYCFEQ
jgi:hypothetical protein